MTPLTLFVIAFGVWAAISVLLGGVAASLNGRPRA